MDLVCILDPKDTLSLVDRGKEVVEERCPGASEVQETSRTRGKPHSHAHAARKTVRMRISNACARAQNHVDHCGRGLGVNHSSDGVGCQHLLYVQGTRASGPFQSRCRMW